MLIRAIPNSLVPEEDQGLIISATVLPDAASIDRTTNLHTTLSQRIQQHPAVAYVTSMAGFDVLSGTNKTNAGSILIQLKPWDQRSTSLQSSFNVLADLATLKKEVNDGLWFSFNPPPIAGLSNTGGFEAYIQRRGDGTPANLHEQVKQLVDKAAEEPALHNVRTPYTASVPQLYINLDREKAQTLGVSVNNVFDTIQSIFGSYYVNDFNKDGRVFKVQLQSEENFRNKVENINDIFITSANGNMIPLAALIKVEKKSGPDQVDRFNVFPAAKILGEPAPGYSSGEALAAMELLAKDTLSENYSLQWSSQAFLEKSAGGAGSRVFMFALLIVFLILVALFESWKLPIVVLLSVPFALFGALLANWICGMHNDLYFQVALVTLIGLSAKNAILIIEFAVLKMKQGESLFNASVQAFSLRFRPIVMTSLAFILGCIPLIMSSGAGAASRSAVGIGVIGGMLGATLIAPMFIPLFFILVMRVINRNKS